jgi:hypothetical protein
VLIKRKAKMPFQTHINLQQAPAVAGDFASCNPVVSVVTPEAGLVTGANGVTVGKFAWIGSDNKTVQSFGSAPNAPDGFVPRAMQAYNTTYMSESNNTIPAGMGVTLVNRADVYAKVAGSVAATRNAIVYAEYATGDITIGSAATGGSVTASIGSTNTASIGSTFTGTANSVSTQLIASGFTGMISIGDVVSGTGITAGTTVVSQASGTPGGAGLYNLSHSNTCSSATVTSFGSVVKVTSTTGLISVGDTITGSGFPSNATIVSQTSGVTGGAGVYVMSAAASAYTASASGVTTFGNVLNVTGVTSGTLAPGFPVSGTGVPSGAVISSQVSGTVGGIGLYTLSLPGTAYQSSTTVTATGGVETDWVCATACAVGELAIITRWNS